MSVQKICVVTGTRAEYGLLRNLMSKIDSHGSLELQLVATAMHLAEDYGSTYREIESDGFVLHKRVHMLVRSDTPLANAVSVGVGTMGLANAFSELVPDAVLILGDRFEALAAAQAAMMLGIPIIHLHGGELTFGAMDDAIRHAVTKLSYLHFVSTVDYLNRVVQLGEHPDRVFDVGALGVEACNSLTLLSKEELARALDFDLGSMYFLMAYHPVTNHPESRQNEIENLLEAIDEFPDAKVLVSFPNSDPGNFAIVDALKSYSERNSERVFLTESFGQLRYLSAMRHASVVIGNSSSGIIEAPSLGTPTVNIGDRQGGRVSASSTIHCEAEVEVIRVAVRQALSEDMQVRASNRNNPYEQDGTSDKILAKIATTDFKSIEAKKFYDL